MADADEHGRDEVPAGELRDRRRLAAPTLKDKPKNVQGLLFKEQEAGYLAGYLAGLYTKDEGGSVSTVGGQKIPPVDHYIAGFRAGAEKANPGVKTLNGYSQDFVDQAKCKEIALDQIAKGSKVVFQVAGQCGLGAHRRGQGEERPGHRRRRRSGLPRPAGLTSALKNVDVAVFDAIKAVQDGSFKGGSRRRRDGQERRRRASARSARPGRSTPSRSSRSRSRSPAGEIADIPDTVGRRHVGAEEPGPMETALELRGITKRFGSIVANDGVDFDLRRGRGPRAARRERRRQVDAHVDPLRALPARRGRGERRRPARRRSTRPARRSSSASGWCTSTSCSSRS